MTTAPIRLEAARSRKQPDAFAVLRPSDEGAVFGALSAEVTAAISQASGRAECTAGRGETYLLYPSEGIERVIVAGLGAMEGCDLQAVRIAAAKVYHQAKKASAKRVHIEPAPEAPAGVSERAVGQAIAEGLMIAAFAFDQMKGKAQRNGDKPDAGDKPMGVTVPRAYRKGFEDGIAIGRGVNSARTLAATPPNVAHPAHIERYCRKLGKQVGLKVSVITAKQAEAMGMGGLCAVGQGGSEPPRMVCMEWKPEKAPAKDGPLLLVGKGITFDTGGYSLKVGGSMKEMKYDKCGAMAVLGTMEAVARLNLPKHVVGVVALAENMIDREAFRVDDILTFYNGVTAEITNTDAEGRLVLADALSYSTKRYNPSAVIDLATLTGGVVVGLGSYCAGMWCNDDALRGRLDAAAETSGEALWRLPLWDAHRDLMRGLHADLVNSAATREAHPIQGAAFLSFFVGKDAPTQMPTLPWAHLDIAGVADTEKNGPLYSKGPTGFGVRLLVEMIRA